MPEPQRDRFGRQQDPRHAVTGVPVEVIAPQLSPLERAIEALKDSNVERRVTAVAIQVIRSQLSTNPETTEPIIKKLALAHESVQPHSFLHDSRSQLFALLVQDGTSGKQFALDTALNENAATAARCAAILAINPHLKLTDRESILSLLASAQQPLRLAALLVVAEPLINAKLQRPAEYLTDSSAMKVAEYVLNFYREDLRPDLRFTPDLERAFPETYRMVSSLLRTDGDRASVHIALIDLVLDFPGGGPKEYVKRVASGQVVSPNQSAGLAGMCLLHSSDPSDHQIVAQSFREGIRDIRVNLFDYTERDIVGVSSDVQNQLAAASREILKQSEFKYKFEPLTLLRILNAIRPQGYLDDIANYFARGAKDPELDGLFEAAAIFKQNPAKCVDAAIQYIDVVGSAKTRLFARVWSAAGAVRDFFAPGRSQIARWQEEDGPQYRLRGRAIGLLAAAPEGEKRNEALETVVNGRFKLDQRWEAILGLGAQNKAAQVGFMRLTSTQISEIVQGEFAALESSPQANLRGSEFLREFKGRAISEGLAHAIKHGQFTGRDRRYNFEEGVRSPHLELIGDIFAERLENPIERAHDISALLSLLPDKGPRVESYAVNLVLLRALQSSYSYLNTAEKAQVDQAFQGVRTVLTPEQWQTYEAIKRNL